MLKNKIVLIRAQIMVHAHNSVYHYLVKKFLSPTASSFNMEKLPTIAACTTEKGKAGAYTQRPTPGVDDFFFFSKKVPLKKIC